VHRQVASSTFDRAAELRKQPEILDRLARTGDARVIVHRGSTVPVTGDGLASELLRLPASAVLAHGASPEQMAFLGMLDGTALFGFETLAGEEELLPAEARWVELIVASMTLRPEDAALMNYLLGLSNWRRSHVFCHSCGQEYVLREGGHVLVCPSGHRSHPRVEPVVQMLVHDRERCLLGRSPGWPSGWFSTLAGFIEPGETPEEATIREVREEAGLEVLDVGYNRAQFFAGPYSLMLGFTAGVADVSTARPGEELETVMAFTRDELRHARATDSLRTPATSVLAGALIETWLDAGAAPSDGPGGVR
jgi:NAD+ diphosphatase